MQHVPCRILPLVFLNCTFCVAFFELCSFELSGPFDEHQEQNARHKAGRFIFSDRLGRREMIFSSQPAADQSRAMHMAMPMPPPMHSVARPFLASRFCISCSSVTSTRAP